MYSVEIAATAQKFLSKIPESERRAILEKIDSIRENPFHFLKRLHGGRLWRLRIMKYRAIIDVIVKNRRLVVVSVGHRKNVYNGF